MKKSPRELLLQRHRSELPKLDTIRVAFVEEIGRPADPKTRNGTQSSSELASQLLSMNRPLGARPSRPQQQFRGMASRITTRLSSRCQHAAAETAALPGSLPQFTSEIWRCFLSLHGWLAGKVFGFWNEVFWSSRRFWFSIAAAWCLLGVFNAATTAPRAGRHAREGEQAQPVTWGALIAEQRRLLVELDNLDASPDSDPQPLVSPRPRTHWRQSPSPFPHEASLPTHSHSYSYS